MTFLRIYFAACVALTMAACGQGYVLTFDDLGDALNPVPNGYGSLQWNNFYHLDPTVDYIQSGYYNGMVSPSNVAFNFHGDPSQITSSTPFALNSGYFTAAWQDGLQLEVQGLRQGVIVYDTTYTLDTTRPTLLNFGYAAVDQVIFSSGGGTPHYEMRSGDHFAVDNLSVTVPEPTTAALLTLAALLGLLVPPLTKVSIQAVSTE